MERKIEIQIDVKFLRYH